MAKLAENRLRQNLDVTVSFLSCYFLAWSFLSLYRDGVSDEMLYFFTVTGVNFFQRKFEEKLLSIAFENITIKYSFFSSVLSYMRAVDDPECFAVLLKVYLKNLAEIFLMETVDKTKPIQIHKEHKKIFKMLELSIQTLNAKMKEQSIVTEQIKAILEFFQVLRTEMTKGESIVALAKRFESFISLIQPDCNYEC
jgi:hypothetical protein